MMDAQAGDVFQDGSLSSLDGLFQAAKLKLCQKETVAQSRFHLVSHELGWGQIDPTPTRD